MGSMQSGDNGGCKRGREGERQKDRQTGFALGHVNLGGLDGRRTVRAQVGLVCGLSALGVLRKHRSGTQVGLANAGLVLYEPQPADLE